MPVLRNSSGFKMAKHADLSLFLLPLFSKLQSHRTDKRPLLSAVPHCWEAPWVFSRLGYLLPNLQAQEGKRQVRCWGPLSSWENFLQFNNVKQKTWLWEDHVVPCIGSLTSWLCISLRLQGLQKSNDTGLQGSCVTESNLTDRKGEVKWVKWKEREKSPLEWEGSPVGCRWRLL